MGSQDQNIPQVGMPDGLQGVNATVCPSDVTVSVVEQSSMVCMATLDERNVMAAEPGLVGDELPASAFKGVTFPTLFIDPSSQV